MAAIQSTYMFLFLCVCNAYEADKQTFKDKLAVYFQLEGIFKIHKKGPSTEIKYLIAAKF